jgi:2-C-methyl-D-erythritol 4-phosphate cytidylyltransferase / 2-C-methyl-D-erythritol 2,4-cyclodiphosphate synthase
VSHRPDDGSPFADAIVVAAGASRRMAGVDKLRVPLAGRPILAWAAQSMSAARSVRRIVLVAGRERVDELGREPWVGVLGASVVAGGPRRQDSVAAGARAADAPVVLVHDGARPFVASAVVDAVAEAAAADGAAIPVVPVAESLKRLDGDRVAEAVERDGLFRSQTPQGVRRDLLLAAYDAVGGHGGKGFSDEAALLAAYGATVRTVQGDPGNLKVTVAADIELVAAIAELRSGRPRLGSATDTHPFGPGDGLRLGGILVAEAPRLFGHSDGDVALHAVAGAVLGAAALGDLGSIFPPDDRMTEGIDSSQLLAGVMARAASAGWRVDSLDLSILGARPRLGATRLDAMRCAIASLVATAPDAVGIKASSGNLTGPEGAGRVISASAIVSLVRA